MIPAEGRGWRQTNGDLMRSFTQNGGRYIMMDHCVPSVEKRYRIAGMLQPTEKPNHRIPGPILLNDLIHCSGEKSY